LGVRVPPDVLARRSAWLRGAEKHRQASQHAGVQNRGYIMREKIIGFFEDVVKEMKKVTWPTKDELKDFTSVVLVATLIMAVFIYAVDTIVNLALRYIL
jgi:preprotein translocase subunit SecE